MKWTKETKYCWWSVSFGFSINLCFWKPHAFFPPSHVLLCATGMFRFWVCFFFSSLKVQSSHHSGFFNFPKPLPVCVPFSQLRVEPGFDKQFYAGSMLCCGFSDTRTDLNTMIKYALPFLCQSCIPVVLTPKYSLILFLMNRFLEKYHFPACLDQLTLF